MAAQVWQGMLSLMKLNISFGLGMVIGSVIGTITTIMITMGYLGVAETVIMYQSLVCGS